MSNEELAVYAQQCAEGTGVALWTWLQHARDFGCESPAEVAAVMRNSSVSDRLNEWEKLVLAIMDWLSHGEQSDELQSNLDTWDIIVNYEILSK